MQQRHKTYYGIAAGILGFILLLAISCTSKIDVAVQSRDSYKSFAVSGMEAFLPKADFKADLSRGEEVFKQNCMVCHVNGTTPVTGKQVISKNIIRNRTPMEIFKFISFAGELPTAQKPHRQHGMDFSQTLSIDDRWNAIFYVRSFYSQQPTREGFEEKFGRNCAICHGKRGHGDGPLAHGLYPLPANFNQVSRMYNRSDAYLYDRITHGAYPTAMPPWKDVEGMKDPAERWRFVDYLRSFTTVKARRKD